MISCGRCSPAQNCLHPLSCLVVGVPSLLVWGHGVGLTLWLTLDLLRQARCDGHFWGTCLRLRSNVPIDAVVHGGLSVSRRSVVDVRNTDMVRGRDPL